jgi:hypothetical protein
LSRDATVPIRLRELALGEDFETGVFRERGEVVSWGHVLEQDDRGAVFRIRAVLCKFGREFRIHSGEMLVHIPASRIRPRRRYSDTRWSARLDLELAARRAAFGPRTEE